MKLSDVFSFKTFAPAIAGLSALATAGCDQYGRPTPAGWILGGAAVGAGTGAIISSTQQNNRRPPPRQTCWDGYRGRYVYCLQDEGGMSLEQEVDMILQEQSPKPSAFGQ